MNEVEDQLGKMERRGLQRGRGKEGHQRGRVGNKFGNDGESVD